MRSRLVTLDQLMAGEPWHLQAQAEVVTNGSPTLRLGVPSPAAVIMWGALLNKKSGDIWLEESPPFSHVDTERVT